MTPILLVVLGLGAALLLAASAFNVPLAAGGRGRLVRRARVMAAAADPKTKAERALRSSAEGSLDEVIRRILPKPGVLQDRLEATGLGLTLTHYGAATLAVIAVFCVLCALLKAPPLMAVIEALGMGIWLPHVGVGLLMARRRNRFLKLFPEAIALVVRGLRAGLPVAETMGAVSREIGDPVGEDFRRIAEHVRLGQTVEGAMWMAAKRIGLPEFNFLVIALSVQRETGGNLAETLENLEHILRRRQQMRLKIKAMASEANASALILGCLPVVMAILMYLVSADYIRRLFADTPGRMMAGAGFASLAVGAFVMRKMTRFQI